MRYLLGDKVPLSLFKTIKSSHYVLKQKGFWFTNAEKGYFVNHAAAKLINAKEKTLFVFHEGKDEPSLFVCFINVDEDDFVKRLELDLNRNIIKTINNVLKVASIKYNIHKIYVCSNYDEDFYKVIDIGVEVVNVPYVKFKKALELPRPKSRIKQKVMIALAVLIAAFAGEYYYFYQQKEKIKEDIEQQISLLQSEYHTLKGQTNRISKQIYKLKQLKILE